ncbi:hypothetical protein KJ969_02165 [Patescibacteria group bacterium]|nr:hypothetical protein [Patescibacteria group bacterium]MBU1922516.1 hypothetical protein [Patescibacteria group bacterium]
MPKKIRLKYLLLFVVISAGLFLISQQPAQGIFTDEEEEERVLKELRDALGWEDGWLGFSIVNTDSQTYRWTTSSGFDYEKDLDSNQSVEFNAIYVWPEEAEKDYIGFRLDEWMKQDWEFGEYQRNGIGNPSIINISGYKIYQRTYGKIGKGTCVPPSFGDNYRTGAKLIAYIPQPDNIVEFSKQRNGLMLLEIAVNVENECEGRITSCICHPISRSEEKAQQIMADVLAFFQPYITSYMNGQCNNNNDCEQTLGENCQTCPDCDCAQYKDDEYSMISSYDFECDIEAAKVARQDLLAEIEAREQGYSRGDEHDLLRMHAFGCVIQADCGNGTCDEGESSKNCCKDCPCPADQECVSNECVSEIAIELNYDKKSAIANGKDLINFTGTVISGNEPVAGENLEISLYAMDKNWEKIVGIGEPDSNQVRTGADGTFSFVYKPKLIIVEDNELTSISIKEEDQIWLMAEVKHSKSGTTNGRKVFIQPYKPKISVEKIVPIQALKGMPLVAGKKMVVMVAMKSEEQDIFEDNEELKLSMNFWIDGDEFQPKNKFEEINIIEPSEDDYVVRIAPEDSGHFNQREFLGIERGIDQEDWIFYNFYVDPQDTHKEGIYFFKTQIFAKYNDSKTGEEKSVPFDYAGYVDDVYPSGFMSVKILPLEIGLWHEDFCNFCTISKGPMEQLANFGKRLIGRKVANDADWEYTCDGSMFAYTWDGIYNDETIEEILNTTTVGRLLSGAEIPPRRDACRWGFIDTFLKTRSSLGGSLLDDLRARGVLAPGSSPETETQKEKYLRLARQSADYFKAVMPVAEENIIIHTAQEPYHLPGLDPNIVLPSYILYKFRDIEAGRVYSNSGLDKLFRAMDKYASFEKQEYDKSGGPEFHGYTRIAAFVPTGEGSNLLFDEEGYESPVFNPSVVLINNSLAEEDVLAHEIAHTYCAIDEDAQARQTAVTPALCGEGGFTINFNWHLDSLGNRVDNGFWVGKREYRGQPGETQYSFMGAAGRETGGGQKRWVTDDLYYGLGVKLGVFPSEKEDYYSNRK